MGLRKYIQIGLLTTMIILGIALLCPSTAHTQSQQVTRHQRQAIQSALKRQDANAIVMVGSTHQRRQIITNRASNGAGKVKAVDPNHQFPIASFQKSITGLAIQQLIDQHKLSLNTKLSKYLPEIHNSQQITIQNLLTHTSGLADVKQIAPQPLVTTKANENFTKHNYKVIHQPGNWHYANVNYGILAMVISKVSGYSYYTYVQKRIFKPFRLTGMHFFRDVENDHQLTPSLTDADFKFDRHETKPWRYLKRQMSAEYGAGQVLATPNSYWQFIQIFLQNDRILKEYQSIKFAPSATPYYGGFYLHPNELHANGSYDGYACTVFVNTKTEKAIMLFSNNITLKQCRNLGYDIYHIYYGTNQQGFPY